jgi:DNA-binding CsgD family transcriptional regulator
MLWCWENRANYSDLTANLETWFMNSVRDAYKALRRNELPIAEDSLADISVSDDPTYNAVEAESAAQTLFAALTPIDREIAALTMKGHTYREICRQGYSQQNVNEAWQRIKQLRRLLPDVKVRSLIRSSVTTQAHGSDDQSGVTPVDADLRNLEFAPVTGADCPPCWRCMWFEGYLPSGKRSTRLDIVDEEVSKAVEATEARKIEIANQVRYGL